MKLKWIAVLALILAAVVARAQVPWPPTLAGPRVWYVDGDLGSDANPGTDAQPRRTMPADADVHDGDRLFLTGRIRGTALYSHKTGVCIERWSGRGKPEMRGDTLVAGPWTTDASRPRVYSATVPLGAGASRVVAVVVDWDTSVNADGFNYGHLRAAASAGECAGTPNSWWFDMPGRRVLVNLGGASPAGHTVAVCATAARNLLQFDQCRDTTVEDVDFALNPQDQNGSGYGLMFNSCAGRSVWRRSHCRDLGKHAGGALRSTAGAADSVLLEDIDGDGLKPVNSTFVVFFSELSEVQHCVGRRLTYRMRGYLGRDGIETATTHSQTAFYAHAGGGHHVQDVEFQDAVAVKLPGYLRGGTGDWALAGDTPAVAETDRYNREAYPLRIDRGGPVGFSGVIFPGSTWLRGVRFNLTPGLLGGNDFAPGGVSLYGASSGFRALVLESCELNGDLGGPDPTRTGKLVRIRDTSGDADELILINCSLYNRSEQTALPWGWRTLVDLGYNQGAKVRARGCIFAHRAQGVMNVCFNYDDQAPGADHDVRDCLYANIPDGATLACPGPHPGGYSQNGSFDTAPEWFGAIDNSGGVVPDPFVNAPADLSLTPGSSAWTLRRHTSDHVPAAGINGLAYTGCYGAYQYGGNAVPADPGPGACACANPAPTIALSGTWPDACPPNTAIVTSAGATIDLEVRRVPPPSGCSPTPTPWSLPVQLGTLTPGEYQVWGTYWVGSTAATARTLLGTVRIGDGCASSCYANCDGSAAAPVLNVADFGCFLQRFASGDPYANCDLSTQAPTLNVADFACFLQKYATGCP